MPRSKKVQGAVKRPTLVKKGKKDAVKRDKVKICDSESTTLLKQNHFVNDVPKSNPKTDLKTIAPKCTPSKASKKEFSVEQVDVNLSNNRSHNTRSQTLIDKPTKKRSATADIPSKKKKRKLEGTTPPSYKQNDNKSAMSEMSHATMFSHECETSPKQNSSKLFGFEEDQSQQTHFNINNSSPPKIEIPSDYSLLVFSANTSTNHSSPSTSDTKSTPSKPRKRSRFIRNNSQSSDRSSESTGRTRKFFPRISKELSTSKESLVSSKSSYSNVKPVCSNSDIDDSLISDISMNDSNSLNRTMISSPYIQVEVMSDELLHYWSKTTENMHSHASPKGKLSNVNSSPSSVNTTKPTSKQPLSNKNKIDIVESSLPTTKKCLLTSKKYITPSSLEQSSTIENKNLYSPSFDILNESLVTDQLKVGRGNSLSNICMPSSPKLNNAKLSLSQCTQSEAQVDSYNYDFIGDKEIDNSLRRGLRRHLSESSSESRISMTREIDEVKSVSKISSEAEVDSKKVVTHSHDVIEDKEIGDFLQRRSRRRLASTSSSDSRISMSRDIDEVETVSKMSFEAEVDSKKVVTHSHDAIVDKEIGDYLQRRSRRRLASTSSSDSRISMSRDIDEVESLSKISSPVSLTKPKITRKLNFPYQQTNLNVAEVKHLDFNQIDLCNTPESISNNSSTTSKINAPSILDDDEEKHLCHETEANTYKSIQLVSTYDSDQVNTTMPAQKQNVVFKVLQTPASQSVVGETPSSICEDISYKSSKSVETLGSDQVTSKLKQNLVRVEKHRVVISDDKMPVTIKSSPHCTSSLDYNSRDTASTSNKRFRLKRNFSSNLSKSNTVQTSSDLYPVEQEKLDFQKTTEKIIPSVQLVRSQNTLEKIPSKEIPDYSSLSTEDALLQTSKNKVTVNSFVNKVTTKTSSEEAKHTKKLIAEMTSKKSSKNNLPSTKPLLTEEFCEALSSQNNSSRMNVKRKKYATPLSTYKANSKDTSTGSLVELVSHSENFPTQLKSNTEVTKTPKQILKDESTTWAQEIIPVNLGSKEKEFNSLKNIGRLTKKVLTPNIPSKKLISNSFNSKPHLPETCLQKSTSITQTTASETLKSSTFHKKIITSNISTSNSTDPNEPSSSLVGRNKKKSLENSANNSSKQVDVFSPQLERSSKTSLSNPTKPLKPFSSSFERPSKASPSNPIILNEPCSPAPERLQKTLSHSSTKPVGHFSLPFETPPKISPSNPPKMVEPFPPKASLSNLTKPFEQFSPPPKRPPITSSNFSKPTKLVSSKFVQHHSLPRLPSDTTTKLATRPTTFNFKPSKPALNNCIRSSKPSWPDNNTIFKHPGNPSDFKKVSHSSLGQSPSTHTSMSNPLVSGNLRNDPTSEDNESDEDLDAISLFAETDIGFEQRPAEVHPKNMHPDNPLARSDSDSDISDNSDNESRPLMLPVPDFINYLNKEKENHQTVTNIPLNDEVDSNEDFPRWRSDIYQECDQSSGNENDGSECSVEVPFRVELDSHNPPSVTAEDRLDTYDDAHGMPEEGELETENENKCFAEEEDNLEDMRYNGTANIDSPNLPDKAAEQHCETNIAHYDDMSGYLMQHGNREDVNLMGYQSPSQHSSSSCRKPQEGRFCFTFLKYGNCKKYPHNCTYNHWVPHLSLYAPIEAGNYLSFTYSKGFNYASNSVLKSLIKEIIDQNETNMDRNDQELWDILVKILKGCGKPVVSLLNTLIETFVSIISDLPLKSFDSAISLLLVIAKYNSLHSTWSSVKSLIWATDLKGTVDVVTKYINVCNTLSTSDKDFIVDVYKYFIELNPAIKNCEDISVRKFASVLQKNGLTHFANNLKMVAPEAFGLKPSEHKPGPSFSASIKKRDESQQNSLESMSALMKTHPHLPQERRLNVLLPPAKLPIPPKRLNNTPKFSSESINNTFVEPDSQVPNTFSDTDLRNKLQINRSSSASSQERSPHDKPTTAHAELSTQHNNRNTNMRRLTRQGKQPSPLDSIPDQTDHILHSQNITRVPKLNNSNPHNVHLSKANILSNATFQERSSDVLDYADTMSSYVRNNEEGFNKPLSYTDDINRTLYNISSAKHPIGNTAIDPKLFCPPGIRAGFNIGVPGVNKYWEDEGYSTNASRLPLPDSSREIFQKIPPLSNFSTQRPFEFQGKYGPNFHCPQRPQLPPPQGPNLPNRVRRRKKQSQTQWNLMQGPPKRNCSPMNEDECRMVFEQEWNFTLKNLKDGDFRSVSARLNSWKSRAERNEFCLRVYQELIHNGESAAPNFRRLVESAVSDSVISLRNDYDLMAMMSSIGMCLLLDLCSKSTWETAYQIHFVMKKHGIDPLISQTEHDATTSQAQKILCCIEVCMNSNHGQDAVDILAAYKLQNPDPNQWQLASNPADVGTRNLLVATLLEGLVESNYIKEARRLFDLLYTAQKCVKKPIDIAKHLNTLLVFLLDANLNVEALNLFLKINQPALPVEVVTYRALLAACVEKHMMKAAETLWRSLGLFGVFSFQEVTYPLVIKMKSYFMKEEIYMELRQYFLQLSKSLCSDQIDANVTECRVNILIEEFPIGEFQRGVKVPLVVKKAELASSYVKVRLKNVLKHDFQIEIDKEWGDNSRLIALKSESVKNYLRKLQFST